MLNLITNLPVLWTEAEVGTWISPKEAHFQNPDNMPPEIALRILIEEQCNVVSCIAKRNFCHTTN